MLNLYWEKTPENVFYDAVMSAMSQLKNCSLVDYTATENSNITPITGEFHILFRLVSE